MLHQVLQGYSLDVLFLAIITPPLNLWSYIHECNSCYQKMIFLSSPPLHPLQLLSPTIPFPPLSSLPSLPSPLSTPLLPSPLLPSPPSLLHPLPSPLLPSPPSPPLHPLPSLPSPLLPSPLLRDIENYVKWTVASSHFSLLSSEFRDLAHAFSANVMGSGATPHSEVCASATAYAVKYAVSRLYTRRNVINGTRSAVS